MRQCCRMKRLAVELVQVQTHNDINTPRFWTTASTQFTAFGEGMADFWRRLSWKVTPNSRQPIAGRMPCQFPENKPGCGFTLPAYLAQRQGAFTYHSERCNTRATHIQYSSSSTSGFHR